MSTTFVLATADPKLAAAWEAQIPAGRAIHRLFPHPPETALPSGISAVVIADVGVESELPASLAKCPTILVGEPHSHPFEQARLAGRARVLLSYDESASRLRDYLPLVEEIAAKEMMLTLMVEKSRRPEGSRSPLRVAAVETADFWDFFEGAIESLDSRDRLLGEFRRASRHLLRASHAVFFLREADGFRADRGTSFFGADDALVAYLEAHPAVIDGTNWDGQCDPVVELAVRNRLALWGARLLVPIHDNGRLLGLIALGIRDDGEPYDENDRIRAVCVARLLRQFLTKSAQLIHLQGLAQQVALGVKHLPSTLILEPSESVPRHVPLVVRDLIGRVRRTRERLRVTPSEGQPFRATAGIVTETGGVWAFWEEISGELHDAAERRRNERLSLLQELALTLTHEVGNPLVSLAALRQAPEGQPPPAPILSVARGDIAKLEDLLGRLRVMQSLSEMVPGPVDLREVVQQVGAARGLPVDVGPEPVILHAEGRLLEMALGALIDSVTENRLDLGSKEMALQLRSTGTESDLTALLSIRGKHLELEGVMPEPVANGVPNQGRLGVFLAKEIIRLHRGEIHAGPGMEGAEILISIRAL